MSRYDLVGFSAAPHLNRGTAPIKDGHSGRRTTEDKLFDGALHRGSIPGEAASQIETGNFPVEFELIRKLTVRVDSPGRKSTGQSGISRTELTAKPMGQFEDSGQEVKISAFSPGVFRKMLAKHSGTEPVLRAPWYGARTIPKK